MIKSLYPKFQSWAEKGAIWLISDPHFDDPDCKIMDSDWPSPQEYIDNIKPSIGKHDTLICLGDVGDKEYFKKFDCYKVLILGNHDAGASTYIDFFNEIYTGPLFVGDRILLSHEPIYGLEDICVNIHGHVHNAPHRINNHVNLAADVMNWELFNLGKEIKKGLLSDTKNYHKITLEKIKNL